MRWNLFVALVLSACCTQKALIAGIVFELSQDAADALVQAPADVHMCIDSACWDETYVPDAGPSINEGLSFDETSRTLWMRQWASPGNTADVTLTATRDGGVLFTREWTGVKFIHKFPNGELCGGDGYVPEGTVKF